MKGYKNNKERRVSMVLEKEDLNSVVGGAAFNATFANAIIRGATYYIV